jgi:hypothetical protein
MMTGEDRGMQGQDGTKGTQGGRKARDKRLIMSLQVNGFARVSGSEAEWTVRVNKSREVLI